MRKKAFSPSLIKYLVPNAEFGQFCHSNISRSYVMNRELNSELEEEEFLSKWRDLVASQIGVYLTIEQGLWDIPENTIPPDVDFSELFAQKFDLLPSSEMETQDLSSPSKRPRDSDAQESGTPPDDETEKRTKSIQGSLDSQEESPMQDTDTPVPRSMKLIVFPVTVAQVTRTSYILANFYLADYLHGLIPESSLLEFPTLEEYGTYLFSQTSSLPVGLVANYNTGEGNPGAWNSGAFSLTEDVKLLVNHITVSEGLLTILPLESTEEATDFAQGLLFATIHGRKAPSNKLRQSHFCRNFSEAKGCTNLLSYSYILWHSSSQVLSDIVSSSEQFPTNPKLAKSTRSAIAPVAMATLGKFRAARTSSYVSVTAQPVQITEEVVTCIKNLSRVHSLSQFSSHIVVVSIDINYNLGHQLYFIRRSLSALHQPTQDPIIKYFEPLPWAEDLTDMSGRTLISCHRVGHRTFYLQVLSHPLQFGSNDHGAFPTVISFFDRIHVTLTPGENITREQYHPDGYVLPSNPLIQISVVPTMAEAAFYAETPPVLLHVRGLGTHQDAHNILYPLIIENILMTTTLQQHDIFIVSNVIHAAPGLHRQNREILIEEQVLTVQYNPQSVTQTQLGQALQ